jgi:O-antigen biosynthesis protein
VLCNGLGMDLANSFLLAVSDQEVDADRNVLAHYFGGQRGPGSFKHSVFTVDKDANLVVTEGGRRGVDQPLEGLAASASPYVTDSKPLVDQLYAVLTSRRSGVKEVVEFFKRYRDVVFQLAGVGGSANPALPAHFLDAIPQNILIDGLGRPQLIDSEWNAEQALHFERLLFRAVIYSLNGCRLIRLAGEEGEISLQALVLQIFQAVGVGATPESLDALAQTERDFQKGVNELAEANHWDDSKHAPIRRPDIYISHASLKRALDAAAHTIAMFQDNEKNMRKVIAGLEQHVSGLEGALEAMKNSTSWKLTRPMRQLLDRTSK